MDFTRIMQYVSPAELERYETEQFRLEAEAEAVAIRTEAEDLARRQLHKNTKLPSNNRGSRMLSGLELPVILPTRARGRLRRSRGRGRRRTRDLVFDSRQLEDETHEELVDSETHCLTDYTRQPIQTSSGVAVQPLLPTAPCLYHQYQRDFLLLFLSRDIQGFRIRIRTWA